MSRNMDQEFYRKELASFLPERMFDMHAHLWSERFCELRNPTGFASDVTYDEYTRLMQQAFPDHVFGGWFLPKPLLKDREKDALAASEWVAEQPNRSPAGQTHTEHSSCAPRMIQSGFVNKHNDWDCGD